MQQNLISLKGVVLRLPLELACVAWESKLNGH